MTPHAVVLSSQPPAVRVCDLGSKAPGVGLQVACMGQRVAGTCLPLLWQPIGVATLGCPTLPRQGGSPVLQEESLVPFRSHHSLFYQDQPSGR